MGRVRYDELWPKSDEVSGIGSGKVPRGGYKDAIIDAPSAVANYEYLLGALRSKAPGQWSQNVMELANHFTTVPFLAINTISNQASLSERECFERGMEEHDYKLPWHDPLCRIIEQPNDDDHWSDLIYQIFQQIGLTGIALVWMPTWKEGQKPTELYVLPTSSCLPWPPSPIYPNGSYLVQPYYPYGPFSTIPSYQSAAGARIPAEQVIRIKNPHPILRYDGYAVLTAIRRQVDTVDAIDLARFNTQGNGVDPSILLSFDRDIYNPDNQPDLNRIRVQLNAMYAGPNNAAKIMPLPIGTTPTKLSHNPQEMAWIEGWEQITKFAMAAYGCPAPVAGLADASNYATLYASIKQFNLISLDPGLLRVQNKFNSQYVHRYWGHNVYLKLSSKKITDEDMELKRADLAGRYKAIKVNELRKMCHLPPLDGDEGNEFVGNAEQAGISPEAVNMARENGRGETPQDQDVERERPRNPMEQAASPKMFTWNNQAERTAEVLDKFKALGAAKDWKQEEKEQWATLD